MISPCNEKPIETVDRDALALEAKRLRAEVKQLSDESESLVLQVVQSFETLTFLRSMAENLELPELSCSPLDMAANSLNDLTVAVEAQGLVLFLCNDDATDDLSEAGTEFHRYGKETLSRNECRQLILLERRFAKSQPVVRNKVDKLPTHEYFKGLHEFVLVEIRGTGRLCGWLIACNRENPDGRLIPYGQEGFTTVEASLLSTAASMLAANFHNTELLRQKESLFTNLVRALVNAVDARDPYTCGHSERVALFAQRLGAEHGLDSVTGERLYLSGLLHDVGKIGVPDSLLQKAGPLTDDEFKVLTTHPESGWEILHELDSLRHTLPGVLHHHECYDGSGYPDRLKGEKIPIDGRIIAICDAYDAMTSNRPYRNGMPQEKAESILQGGAGTQWDPDLIAAFFRAMPDIIAIRQDFKPRKHDRRQR